MRTRLEINDVRTLPLGARTAAFTLHKTISVKVEHLSQDCLTRIGIVAHCESSDC